MSEAERPRGWFAAILQALDWLRAALVAVGGALVLSGLVLVLVPAPSVSTEHFRVITLVLTGCGLFFGAFAAGSAMVGLSRGLDGDRDALFLAPAVAGLLLLGVTVLQEVDVHLRIAHAPVGGLSLALLLGSLVTGRRAIAPISRLLRLEPGAGWRGLAITTGLSLGCGGLVSFLPLLLERETPRDCALRIAGIAALSFAVPAFAALRPLHRFRQQVLASADAADFCPECGYPRPPRTRCPECGREPGTFPTP